MIVGDIAMLKLFRRVASGPHPEAEMGRYLTEHGYANIPPLLGEVVRVDPDGERHAIAVAQGFIRNQGDAWTWTLDLLTRGLSDLTAGTQETQATEAGRARGLWRHRLSVRTASGRNACRAGRRFGRSGLRARTGRRGIWWNNGQTRQSNRSASRSRRWTGSRTSRGKPSRISLPLWPNATRWVTSVHQLARSGLGETVTRIHGDLHLGQALGGQWRHLHH